MGYDALQIGTSVSEELSASIFSVLEVVFNNSTNEGKLLGKHWYICTSIHNVTLRRPKSLSPARELTLLCATITFYLTPFQAQWYTYVLYQTAHHYKTLFFPGSLRHIVWFSQLAAIARSGDTRLVVVTEPEWVKADKGLNPSESIQSNIRLQTQPVDLPYILEYIWWNFSFKR
jgi:hypothetical protein